MRLFLSVMMNGEDLRVKSTQELANVHAAIDKYG